MKKLTKRILTGLALSLSALTFVPIIAPPVQAAVVQQLPKGSSVTYQWKTTNQKYENFTDLGDYVIDVDRHTNFDFQSALDYFNKRCTRGEKVGCSALGTITDNGDVIIGRNLDLTVSQLPCYITHVKFGKYETLNFTYDQAWEKSLKYDELLAAGKIDPEYYNALPLGASDSMNSEGLFIEYNMRNPVPALNCTGTNPNAPIRVCSVAIPFLVASHCATVDEALKYLNEQLDIYTIHDGSFANDWNLCMMIGDATGQFGLIEIANNEVHFIPKQRGQGNYYIWPAFSAIAFDQEGYGRLQFGLERLDNVQNDKDMADLMEQIMWRNEILNIGNAYRDKLGHLHFCDDAEHKIPSIDWRSDNFHRIPVNENGKYVDVDEDTAEARLVRGYKEKYKNYLSGIDTPENKAGFDKYKEYLNRHNLVWAHTDANFEDLQKGLTKFYEEIGAFEKLEQYYSGNEKPLRDDGNVWTTALSLSVNCTQKRLSVKFWEKPNTVMHYQW